MKQKNLLLFRLVVLVTAMMCAFGAAAAEAYANYTSSNTTLTFYCDNQRSSRTGTTYDLNTGDDNPGWYRDNTKNNVTKVVFDPSFADAKPTTTCAWFRDMTRLQTITGLYYLNTSQVTSMRGMFSWCDNLQSVDVSNFNTANVTNMIAMFAYCEQLSSLNLSNFSTSNVTLMSNMFVGCHQLTSLDVSNFNTDKVTNMYAMFGECPELTSLNLSGFNTAKVTDMSLMFHDCSQLQTIYVGDGWSTTAVTNSLNMFKNCTSLVGGMGTTYDASHIDKPYAHIDGGPTNPGYFTEWKEAYACYTESNTTLTFYYDGQRSSRTGTTYDLNTGSNDTGWESDGTGTNASVTKVVFDPSFADARPTTTFDWFYNMRNLQSITGMSYLNTSEVTNMNRMFYNCKKLTSLDVSHFNMSKVKLMRWMFAYCTGLTSLDLSSFNTANVTDMRYMFNNSYNLQTIYVGNDWSTAAVTYSDDMFENCTSLVGGMGTTYDENHIDGAYAHIDGGPSNPGYLTEIPEAYACYTESNTTLTFYCDNQRSSRTGTTYDVNLNQGSSFPAWFTNDVVSNVTKAVFDPSFANARPTSTGGWFFYMSKLKSITGLNFLNTSEVTYMASMFADCSNLTNLDLSSWNTAKVTDMRHMFRDCSGLTTIYVGDEWSTSAVTQSTRMFYGCTSLEGGKGTTYDENHIDGAYAHIDGGPSNPGYFTDKNAALRGDVNGDGSVNVADVTALIQIVLNSMPADLSVADLSGDGQVNVADVTVLIQLVLNN